LNRYLLAAGMVAFMLSFYVYSLGPVHQTLPESQSLVPTGSHSGGTAVVDSLYDNVAVPISVAGKANVTASGHVSMAAGLTFYVFDTKGFDEWVSSNYTTAPSYVWVHSTGNVTFSFVPDHTDTYEALFYNPTPLSPKSANLSMLLTWNQSKDDSTRQTYSTQGMLGGTAIVASSILLPTGTRGAPNALLSTARRPRQLLGSKTLGQLVGYGLVSLGEYGAGVIALKFLTEGGLYYLYAFTLSQAVIGLAAFAVRKVWVFKA
jgi:hypothetical protein